jgi:type I restriction enzyme S subunit
MSWDMLAIGDFCRTGSGGTPSRKKASRYFGGNIPWIKSGELREGVITETEETITELAVIESSAKFIPKGALLVAMYGATIGRVAKLGIDATSNQAVCHILPDESLADMQYMFYALQAQVPHWLRKGVGGAQSNISQEIIKNTVLPLPPLEEQRRIAAILDRAKGIKAKAAQRSGLLAALSTSLFVRRFGLPSENPYELPIYKLVDICNPKQWPTISSKQLQGAGYPVFGANGPIGYFDRFNHPDPTVLVTCRGATCGTINISPPNCYVTGNSMAMDNPDPGLITKDYLAWVLRLRGMNDVISGSAQPQITRQGLEAVTIPVPSIDAQNYFANELRSITRVGKSSRLSESSISAAADCLAARFFGGGHT